MWKQILAASGAVLLATTAAMADASAITTGNLNIRGGPGTNYHVMGVIMAGSSVTVRGCVNSTNWCFVNFAGMEGWSNAHWLTTQSGMPASAGVRSYAFSDLSVVGAQRVTTYASTTPTYANTYSTSYGSNYYNRAGRIGDGRGLFGRPRVFGPSSGISYGY